jgi:hypothetical protein
MKHPLRLLALAALALTAYACSTICGIPGISSLSVCSNSPTATPTPIIIPTATPTPVPTTIARHYHRRHHHAIAKATPSCPNGQTFVCAPATPAPTPGI